MKKVYLLFSLVLLLSAAVLSAQSVSDKTGQGVITSVEDITLSTDLSSISVQAPSDVQPSSSGESSVFLLLRMIVVLSFVIALLYGVFFFIKRTNNVKNDNNPFLRIVSKISISQGKSVQVVTVLNHGYLIGVSENGINLISEINDEELVKSMNVYADSNENVSRPKSFTEVLDMFITPSSKQKSNIYEGNTLNPVDLIKQQRDKLNR